MLLIKRLLKSHDVFRKQTTPLSRLPTTISIIISLLIIFMPAYAQPLALCNCRAASTWLLRRPSIACLRRRPLHRPPRTQSDQLTINNTKPTARCSLQPTSKSIKKESTFLPPQPRRRRCCAHYFPREEFRIKHIGLLCKLVRLPHNPFDASVTQSLRHVCHTILLTRPPGKRQYYSAPHRSADIILISVLSSVSLSAVDVVYYLRRSQMKIDKSLVSSLCWSIVWCRK